MNGKDSNYLKETILVTNQINSLYVDEYDALISKQKIGDKTNYVNILNRLNDLYDILQPTLDQTKEIGVIKNISADTNSLLKHLIAFQEVLMNRISLLREITNKLYFKSEGKGNKYSFLSYRRDIKKIKHLENKSGIIGTKLQYAAEKHINGL